MSIGSICPIPFGRHLLVGELGTKGHRGEQGDLVGGVDPVDVEARVGLGVPEVLRPLEHDVEVFATALHLREDVVRGAVDDAAHRLDPVGVEPFPERSQDRDAATDARLEGDVGAALLGGVEQALPVEREERLVGRDHGLARGDRPCDQSLRRVVAADQLDHEIVVVRGAGAYICGEETGLLESLEGKKGQPRKKPPFPAQYGAFGMPTTVNNVETFSHVPHIVGNGAEWFRGFGTEKSPGTTVFGVSGLVKRPGLYELPLGSSLQEIVFEHAGGPLEGRTVKGVIPGGMSMPILPASQLDVPMANEFLRERKTMLGTGGVMVMDDTTCMVRASCVITWFFRDESCGQCTQCREGTGWLNKIVERIERGAGVEEDLDLLDDVAAKMEGGTICAFADAAAWPVQGMLRHFREEFEAHVREGKCPFPGSFEL